MIKADQTTNLIRSKIYIHYQGRHQSTSKAPSHGRNCDDPVYLLVLDHHASKKGTGFLEAAFTIKVIGLAII